MMPAVPFNRRQLAAGLVVATILAVQLPLWSYTGDVVAGLEPHCELDGESFRMVTVEGTPYPVTGADGSCVSQPLPGDFLYSGDLTPVPPARLRDDAEWIEPDSFYDAWLGAYLRVGLMLLPPLLLASAAVLVVLRWQGGGDHERD